MSNKENTNTDRELILKSKRQKQKEYEERTGYAAQQKYAKTSTKRYTLSVMKNTEGDILEKLDSVPNVNGYIKGLIRADMVRDTAK